MLLQDFYKVNTLQQLDAQRYVVQITLNKAHPIFKGHFPGNPVTPGVCMLQIIKELAEDILSKKLFMVRSSNVKFMALINPEIHDNLRVELDISPLTTSDYKVKNVTYFDDTVALKLVNTYKVQ